MECARTWGVAHRDWLRDVVGAVPSDEAWHFAQALLGQAAASAPTIRVEAADERDLLLFLADISTVHEGYWDPAKHPRGAFPQNRGWFSPTGDSASGGGPAPEPRATGGDSAPPGESPPQSPGTKLRLPADHRGTWTSGTRGEGVFRYNHSPENQSAGLAGKEVRFRGGHIAEGGFPPEMYYGGSAAAASVEIGTVTGTRADNLAADAAMRKKLGNPNWQRPEGFVWNHAGSPGSKAMELVNGVRHEAIAHKGPAAGPRAELRARGMGRAMGALTVYMAARDALQATGALQSDFEVGTKRVYHFRDADGSVFIVYPAGWFSDAKREYVAGPRRGQTETISGAQADAYVRQAEAEFGKYIPGTLFREPRFIPGRQRSRLPLFGEEHGVRQEIGWIDDQGVHYYSTPKPAIA